MITLSEILDIRIGSNLCKVRIPIFEPAGNKVKVELWATMILPPGIHGGYEVGDVVFVSFTDNSLSRPVVLGQLYRGTSSSSNRIDGMGSASDKIDKASDFTCINLTAEGNVTLPSTTKLTYASGASHYATLQAMAETVTSLSSQVTALSSELGAALNRIASLEGQVASLEDQVANLQPEEDNRGFWEKVGDAITGN
jgi:hypothetical protein